jgi:hypothetical protein
MLVKKGGNEMLTEDDLYFPAIPAFSFSLQHGVIEFPSTKNEAAVFLASRDTRLVVGTKLYELSAGECLLLPPLTLAMPTKNDTPPFGYRVSLPYEILSVFAPKTVFRAANMGCVLSFSPNTERALFSAFEALIEKREPTVTALPALLSYLDKESDFIEKESIPLPLLLRRALTYLTEHADEGVTALHLAERYQVSESTVLRVFRNHLGITPLTYMKHLRQII